MSWRKRLARGFTLIEIAIVLVVIGLVLSGGLAAVAPVLQSSKVNETNAKLDHVEQALTLYVIRYGCLPCPADANLSGTTANAGKQNATNGGYTTSGCAGANATPCVNSTQGVVPWITLGLSENDTLDGFGDRIDYAVTGALALTSGMVRTPPATYPAGTLTVQKNANNSSQQITTAAAYVLISHGNDRSLAWTTEGKQILDPNGTSDADQANNGNGSPFVQDIVNGAHGNSYFDDIVRFRTGPLIIQLCGTNACGNPA